MVIHISPRNYIIGNMNLRSKLRKLKKRHWVIIGIVLLIILLIAIRKNNQDPYSAYTVTRTDVSDELLLAGTVDARDRVDLGFASSGRVKAVHFKVGDQVKKGDVIAEIEQNKLVADLTQAQANYTLTKVDTSVDTKSAEDDYATILAEQNEIVDNAYRALLSNDLQAYATNETSSEVAAPTITGTYNASIEGDYAITVYSSGASSGYSFQINGLENGTYTAQVNQPGRLGAKGLFIQFESGDLYKGTEWTVPVPNNRSSTYTTYLNAYENAVKARDRLVADAENNLVRNSAIIDGTVTRNDARRQQAASQVNAVYAQLGDGKITAPFDGIVAKNDLEVGEIVNAFTPEIVVFGDLVKQLDLNVPEIYINKIGIGDQVSVTLDAYEDLSFNGVVDFIDLVDTEVDGVPVYQTDVTILEEDDRIRVGMNAKASIVSAQRESVLAVPAHYLVEQDGQTYVRLRYEGNDAGELTLVTTGLRGNDGLIEIIDGVSEGDVVVTDKDD